MIGYISGLIVHSDVSKTIILTQQGIGYEVHIAGPLVPNKEISVFISHIIREQSQDLYGFESIEGKSLFELLTTVNGIGPKSAFSLISHLGIEQIFTAINFENVDVLKSAPGVGKKSAEQIVLSLKDKITKMEIGLTMKSMPEIKADSAKTAVKNVDSKILKETLAACQELGYRDQDVLPILQKHLKSNDHLGPESLLKLVLQEMR